MKLGLWLSSTDPMIGAVALGSDLDLVVLDQQHAFTTDTTVWTLRQAAAADASELWVRVPNLDPAGIGKVLDSGADGVVVPLVSTPEQAREATRSCHYPPDGTRSFGPITPAGRTPAGCLVMIETTTGVENASAIAATPGLSGVLVGTADLALDLGVPIATSIVDDGPLRDAMRSIADACRAAGVTAGIGVATWEQVPDAVQLGYDLVMAGGERGLLREAIGRSVSVARSGG